MIPKRVLQQENQEKQSIYVETALVFSLHWPLVARAIYLFETKVLETVVAEQLSTKTYIKLITWADFTLVSGL